MNSNVFVKLKKIFRFDRNLLRLGNKSMFRSIQ